MEPRHLPCYHRAYQALLDAGAITPDGSRFVLVYVAKEEQCKSCGRVIRAGAPAIVPVRAAR